MTSILLGGALFAQDATVLPKDFFNPGPENSKVYSWVENQGIFIENAAKLENVHYLIRVDEEKQLVHVGYFLDWKNEFPDFGTTFKTTPKKLLGQILAPLVYTNFLYIPNSGGVQRVQFGKHDVEGIYARYSFDESGLTGLKELRFELPGHKEISVPNKKLKITMTDVSQDGIPWLKVASWNHLFAPPDKNDNTELYKVSLFPRDKWLDYNMDRKRAETGKKYLLAN